MSKWISNDPFPYWVTGWWVEPVRSRLYQTLKIHQKSLSIICADGKLEWLCQSQWNCADTKLLRTNQVFLSLKVRVSKIIRTCISIYLEISGAFQLVTDISTELQSTLWTPVFTKLNSFEPLHENLKSKTPFICHFYGLLKNILQIHSVNILIKFTPPKHRVLHLFQLTLLVTSSLLQNQFCSLVYSMKGVKYLQQLAWLKTQKKGS